MISRPTTALCLALLAGCGRLDDLPEKAALVHQALAAPTPLWNLSLPGSLHPTHVAAIDRKDFLLAGWFDGSLELDGQRFVSRGPTDLLLFRMDANGHLCWAKQLGSGGEITSFASNGQELALSGFFDLGGEVRSPQTVVIAKLGASGTLVWSKPIPYAGVRRVSIDDAGSVAALIDGNSRSPYPGRTVVKLSADGRELWTHPTDDEMTRDITLTREGDLITVGQHRGRRRLYDVGYEYEATLARYDPEGNMRWTRRYGAPDEKHFALRVVVDDAGNLFVEQASGKTLPRSSGDIRSLARTPSGALLITGQSHGRFRLDGDDAPTSTDPLTTFVAAYRLGTGAGSSAPSRSDLPR